METRQLVNFVKKRSEAFNETLRGHADIVRRTQKATKG